MNECTGARDVAFTTPVELENTDEIMPLGLDAADDAITDVI